MCAAVPLVLHPSLMKLKLLFKNWVDTSHRVLMKFWQNY